VLSVALAALEVPRGGLEPPVLGLKVQSIGRFANGAWPVPALPVYFGPYVLSLRIELSLRLLIRQLRPPCRPERPQAALAASELNRAIPPYQGGPVDRLGRGQQMGEEPTPSARAPHRFQAGACRPAGFPSIARNEEVPTPTACTASRFRGGARHRAGSRSKEMLSRPV
jgi:hypothetical protein